MIRGTSRYSGRYLTLETHETALILMYNDKYRVMNI